MRSTGFLRQAHGPAIPQGPLDRIVRTIAWARVALTATALVVEILAPTETGRARVLFFLLLGVVFLPYATAVLLLRERNSPLLRLGTPAVDILMLFAFAAVLSPPNLIPRLANVIVVIYAGAVGGVIFGLAAGVAAAGLSVLAHALNPSDAADVFFSVMYTGLLIATALMVEGLMREHRLRQAHRAQLHISTLSHELRTPLTSISGFARILTERWRQLDSADRSLMLHRISANTAELEALIEQLLDFAAIQEGVPAGATSPQPLRDTVTGFVEAHRPALGDHPVAVDIPPGVAVVADPRSLDRILANLLSNAAKYSPEGSEIEVAARPNTGGRVVVAVRDHGPGIPPEDRERIFLPYDRGRNAGTKRGFGLGLAVTRAHVERNAGRIWIEDAPGEGSIFLFALPTPREQAAFKTPVPPPP